MVEHEPVMVDEVVTYLAPGRGGVFVDCTVGLGGHARAILAAGASRLVGLDRDLEALTRAREELAGWSDRVDLVHADFRELTSVLDGFDLSAIDGAIADFGVSSLQLDGEGRGFSFRRDEPLDMRMDRTRGPSAADLLRDAAEATIADAIYQFGEERYSRRIARSIVRAREIEPLRTTAQLAGIVRRAVPGRGYRRIDPATRTFQALRIWVNRELEGLDVFLVEAVRRLCAGGRLVVISFHSLEDRIVKQTLRALERGSEMAISLLPTRPIVPRPEEIERNHRARSAKLRAAERVA